MNVAVVTDQKRVLWLQVLVIFYGILSIVFAFCAQFVGPLLQASMTFMGIIGGPMLAVFTLGILVPYVNQKVKKKKKHRFLKLLLFMSKTTATRLISNKRREYDSRLKKLHKINKKYEYDWTVFKRKGLSKKLIFFKRHRRPCNFVKFKILKIYKVPRYFRVS